MKHILLVLLLLLSPNLWGQEKEIPLWPNDPDKAEAMMYFYEAGERKENEVLPAVLIFPGGGYAGLAMDNEGYRMGEFWSYKETKVLAFVVKYRMPKGDHTIPLSDAEQAMSIVRSHAKEWNIDPNRIGVVGSSAGGHLAASLSTLAADKNRPNFAVLFYPVISFDDALTHMGSKKNLLGKHINNKALVERYTLQNQVDEKTPPTLILTADDDKVVHPYNSILYYEALHAKKIPAAIQMYPVGDHGFGTHFQYVYYQENLDMIRHFLQSIEIIK